MLGWLRKKRITEQIKLVYQNVCAAESLLAWYDEGDNDTVTRTLCAIQQRAMNLQGSDITQGIFDDDTLRQLLQDNRDLRYIYDRSLIKQFHGQTFDEQFRPLVGWKRYFATELEL